MSDTAGVVVLVGRIMFAFFFGAVAGVGHFKRDRMMRGYAQQAGFPVPAIAGWVAGLWLILGALSVAVGIWPDLGSLMIGAFVIPAALFFHRFWTLRTRCRGRPRPSSSTGTLLPSGRRSCSSEPL